ncbi:MAG: hypothetical protein P1U56_08900 [Saprospiraceae bacterium]|nr:hypothetical protein [Saprospiraceae bacterium]
MDKKDKEVLKDDIVSLPYISAYTFRYYADHGWMSGGRNDKYILQLPNGIKAECVKEGDVIYVTTELLDRFFDEVDPNIDSSYILISGLNDRGVNDLLSNKISDKIIHWYTHNNVSNHPKVSTIPMGFQNLHWRMDDHPQSDVRNIISAVNEDIEVVKDILVSFRIETNPKDRQPCFDYFNSLGPWVTQRQNFEEQRTDKEFVMDFFREIRRHKFVVCPFGNAFDCHRNWETFALGGIPIIMKHKSMESFYDMPAWFVEDWSEVTKDSMNEKYHEMKKKWNQYNHEKIYFEYWKKQVFNNK